MKLLVSVRSSEEALLAARGGADFIDLKEPGAGALGGLPVAAIRGIVAALREAQVALPISATIGDLPMHALAEILVHVDAVAACGVDYVKVGIPREPGAAAGLDALAACGHRVVPVFIADLGLDFGLIEHAAALRFPGLMVDTANKTAGSLFELARMDELRRFVDTAHGVGAMAGLAGALRLEHAPALAALAPGFAGFRSAVCAGSRSNALEAQRLHALVAALASAAALAATLPDAQAQCSPPVASRPAPRVTQWPLQGHGGEQPPWGGPATVAQRSTPRNSPSSNERICASSVR